MLALVSNPPSITDAGPIDTLPREAALVAGFGRGGVREEDKVKQNIHHQVSADTPQVDGGGWKEFSLTFPPRIHVFSSPPGSSKSRVKHPVGLWVCSLGESQAVSIITNKSCMLSLSHA